MISLSYRKLRKPNYIMKPRREKRKTEKIQSEGSLLGSKSGRSNSLKTSESTLNKKHVNSSYVNNGKLICIYTNADQLNNKFNELQLLVKTHDPDIIAITEVKPKNCRFQPQIGEYLLDGYNMWGANIENKSGRSCLLYAKIKLGAKEILLKKLYNEYVSIEITCANQTLGSPA